MSTRTASLRGSCTGGCAAHCPMLPARPAALKPLTQNHVWTDCGRACNSSCWRDRTIVANAQTTPSSGGSCGLPGRTALASQRSSRIHDVTMGPRSDTADVLEHRVASIEPAFGISMTDPDLIYIASDEGHVGDHA